MLLSLANCASSSAAFNSGRLPASTNLRVLINCSLVWLIWTIEIFICSLARRACKYTAAIFNEMSFPKLATAVSSAFWSNSFPRIVFFCELKLNSVTLVERPNWENVTWSVVKLLVAGSIERPNWKPLLFWKLALGQRCSLLWLRVSWLIFACTSACLILILLFIYTIY